MPMITRILVVDDSTVQRDHAVGLCRELVPEANIRQCTDGNHAVEELRKQTADIVVMDLEMPVMDGVLLASHIARESLASAIVICSSKDPLLIGSVGVMSESAGLRVLGMLQKPIQVDSLRQSFEKLFVPIRKPLKARATHPKVSREELDAAIARGEIELFYQPKLTSKGLLLKGVEALARWRHESGDIIPPPLFIPLAETTGLIDQLTISLLEQGIKHIKSCEKRGLRISMSFNLSPQSLSNPHFGEQIETLANASGVDSRSIIFEVTENMLLENLATSLQFLARLRLKGFGMSIDDYGTGFANAEQLAMLPATELKIDRSLVDGASKKWQQRQILESIVRLAQNLKLTTVAEGIEEFDDYQLLCELDVDLVQGFLFAKPMPADQFFNWVSKDLSTIRKRTKIKT